MEPRLEITSLNFSYHGRPLLLDGIDLKLYKGEFVGLIGPNGAGKTTLLRLALGTLRPGKGSITLIGKDPAALNPIERARLVACLPQRQQAPDVSTVYDIVMGGRRPYRGISGYSAEDEHIAISSASRFGVEKWLHRKGSELSGGELQRVLLARAVAQKTSVLLCDEPASSLDPKHLWATFRHLRELAHTDGVATLVSVHDLSLAASLCDRIVVLSDGHVHYDGLAGQLDEDLLSHAFGTTVHKIQTHDGSFFTYT